MFFLSKRQESLKTQSSQQRNQLPQCNDANWNVKQNQNNWLQGISFQIERDHRVRMAACLYCILKIQNSRTEEKEPATPLQWCEQMQIEPEQLMVRNHETYISNFIGKLALPLFFCVLQLEWISKPQFMDKSCENPRKSPGSLDIGIQFALSWVHKELALEGNNFWKDAHETGGGDLINGDFWRDRSW